MSFPLLITASGIIVSLLTTFIATDIRPARLVDEIEQTLKWQLIISTVIMTPVCELTVVWFAMRSRESELRYQRVAMATKIYHSLACLPMVPLVVYLFQCENGAFRACQVIPATFCHTGTFLEHRLTSSLRNHCWTHVRKRCAESQVAYLLAVTALPAEFTGIFTADPYRIVKNWHVCICVVSGLWGGLLIGIVTEYYTSNRYTPVQVLLTAVNVKKALHCIKCWFVARTCTASSVHAGAS